MARALVVAENLPGLSVAVGINGDIVWAEGFGRADIDDQVPVNPLTLFRVGSVAKPMTVAAVGLLHERGRLDLAVRAGRPGTASAGSFGAFRSAKIRLPARCSVTGAAR